MVDDLNLHQYTNLAQWVAKLDKDVEKRLILRLEAGIQEWTRALHAQGDKLPVSSHDFSFHH